MRCLSYLCSILLVETCNSANIVVFMSQPFYSHQAAYKPLCLELAKRGHKITLIQPHVTIQNNENITHIPLDRTYGIMDKYKLFHQMGENKSIFMLMLSAWYAFTEVMEYQLSHPGVQELLKGDNKVDLFLGEYLAPYVFAVGRKLKVPMIGVISMDALSVGHSYMGNPTHPVMYPDKTVPFSPPLSFMERVISVFSWLGFNLMFGSILFSAGESIIAKQLGDVDDLDNIMKNISLLFTNANPLFNVVRPLGPKTINIGGGVHLLEPQPLPKDIQDYLDSAKDGVVYFSLGSSINSKHVHENTKKVIVETFAQLPHNVLWKFDEDIPEISKNVKLMKWVPQQDVLRHKNVKVFITQGGLQSVEEALFSYVPTISLPFYGDQLTNAGSLADKGCGLVLDHTKLDVITFKAAIQDVLNNPKYRERTKELADLIMDQPMTGVQKAVWWTEYVLRHGGTEHFRDPAVDTPWYQFLLLDVISFVLVATVVAIYALFKAFQLLKWVISKIYNILTKKNKEKEN